MCSCGVWTVRQAVAAYGAGGPSSGSTAYAREDASMTTERTDEQKDRDEIDPGADDPTTDAVVEDDDGATDKDATEDKPAS